MKLLLASICVVVSSLSMHSSEAATCSCAGAPLLSSLDASSAEKGDLFFSLTSEFHEMSDLVRGTTQIRDETNRSRSSLSQVLSVNYGISRHWSVLGLISYIEHSRTVGLSIVGEQTSSGLGDGVLLFRYTPLFITPFSRHELSLGFGARMPVGKDDARGAFFTLSEDMQPSVGSVGTIAWASHSYAFNQASTLTLNTSANYTFNDDENDRSYAFGDEFNIAVGISHSPTTRFGYSAGVRYRNTNPDTRFGGAIPNTGGEWVDFVPGINYSVNENLTLGLSGRIPVYRDLDGALQFTTTYSYALSFTYKI